MKLMYNVHRICVDKPVAITPDECLVYSFGFSGDWTFEELMANYGCRVYVFDHRLKKIGDHKLSSRIKLYSTGLFNRDFTAGVLGVDGLAGIVQFQTLLTVYNLSLIHISEPTRPY